MRRGLCSPYGGLIITGTTATIALLIEPRLRASSDTHFLIQFVWMGVVGAALLAFALKPALHTTNAALSSEIYREATTEEFFDEDRLWLQTHPDSGSNE